MPSPCRTAIGLHCTGKSGGLAMENDEEGCAPPTADVANFEVAARGETACPRSPTRWTRSRSFAQRSATGRSGSCRPRNSRTRRRARRPRAADCSLTAADTWRVAIQDGSGDGDGGNLICWMGTPWGSSNGDGGNLIWWIGTPIGAVDAGPELTCDGCCSCSGCCGGAPGAAEATRSGGCHCSQGWAVVAMDGSCSGCCSGPASVAMAAW